MNFITSLRFFIHLMVLLWIVLINEVSTANNLQCVHATSENQDDLKLKFLLQEHNVSKKKILSTVIKLN